MSGEGQNDPPEGGGPEKTLPQSTVNSIVVREKAAAVAAEQRRVAELLGVTPEEAAAKLKELSDRQAAELSEAQRAQKAAEDAHAAAEKARRDANEALRDTVIERVLTRVGFSAGEDREALGYALRLLSHIAVDATEEQITGEVESMKTRLPGLFVDAGQQAPPPGGTPPAPSSDASPPARPRTPSGPWGAAGQEEAVRRGWVKPPSS